MKEVHGIPLWLLREYLEELGGTAVSDTQITGEGWTVNLTKLPPREVGSLRVGQVEVAFSGDETAINAIKTQFHKKTMRAGA
ncbi:MAG: DUF1952 domain-containing protein [Chloroflexi bacterium]|nr:MAG: DUF1952 domain-containing protein [Chloroflexota bacterium]